MKIFTTGGTGFVGRAFCELASARGHQVAGLRRPERLQSPDWKAIARFAPDVVLHSAWIATPGVYLESPENADYLRWSVQFAQRLFEMGVPRFVAVGTCIEYAPSKLPLSEATGVVLPLCAYAAAKNELRIALEQLAYAHEASWAWGRLFYPYGPGEHPQRLASSITRSLLKGEKVTLQTPDSIKDYIYISDVASAFLAVLEADLCGPINIGTGQGVAIREMARVIARLLNREELLSELSPPRQDNYPYVVADATKLMSLGWRPHCDLNTGLRNLIDSIRES